jgi:hypothetical protein
MTHNSSKNIRDVLNTETITSEDLINLDKAPFPSDMSACDIWSWS